MNILGVNHIEKLGLKVNCLLKTKMVVNCANDIPGDILEVFYARIKAKHRTTGKYILLKSMVYVMEGSSILLSRKTLQDFGCIPPDFPQAGQFKNANLAHMRSSKEARLSLTQERGNQGLPYQVSSNGEVKEQTAKQKVQLLQRQPDLNSAGPIKSSVPEEVAILAVQPPPTSYLLCS